MAVPELTPSLLHTNSELPTLIAGPSLGTAALPLWGPAVPYLKEHFQIIVWDLPGHGVSKPSTQEFTLAELATGTSFLYFLGDPGRTRTAYRVRDFYRLREIKRRYDPDNRFRVNHNIAPA